MPKKLLRYRIRRIVGAICTVIVFAMTAVYFYMDRDVTAVIGVISLIPAQIYWGAALIVAFALIATGFYQLDRCENEFQLVRCFIDPYTKWPVFTNVVLAITLVFSIWMSVLLAYNQEWKLAVDLVEAILTAFVGKYAIAMIANMFENKQKKEVRKDVNEELDEKKLAEEAAASGVK